jgi:hypothetical protein
MKKHFYLLILSFSLISCYTYKIKSEKEATSQDTREIRTKKMDDPAAGKAIANVQASVSAIEPESPKKNRATKDKTPRPTTIQEKLEANKYFRIEVGGKPYKIQVDKWESDTLVAHVIHKPKKILKFHKNQIDQSKIAERRFSQPVADIITVVAYAGIGVGIWTLVK